MSELNKRFGQQRKAMLHILVDYEGDRRRVARQAERLDNSRRALLHILQDVHRSNERLGDGRKAMIHIMGDLRETTEEIQRREPVRINGVVRRSFSLLHEQLRLREIEVQLDLCAEDPVVIGNAIQLEQVVINLLTNARDALADAPRKLIHIESAVSDGMVDLLVRDTGPGIDEGLEQR